MRQEESAPHTDPALRVKLGALFLALLKVSLCGFGGGLIWAHRAVVEQRRWMDDQEFAETLTLCQLMPGPNIVVITVCVGAKLRGRLGPSRL
jgi:chromate transporter